MLIRPLAWYPSSASSSVVDVGVDVDVDVDDSTRVHGAKSYLRFRVNLNPSRSMQLYPRHEGILAHIRIWDSTSNSRIASSPTETGTGVGTDIWSIENTRHQWSSSLALLRVLPLHGHYNPPEHHASRPAIPRFTRTIHGAPASDGPVPHQATTRIALVGRFTSEFFIKILLGQPTSA